MGQFGPHQIFFFGQFGPFSLVNSDLISGQFGPFSLVNSDLTSGQFGKFLLVSSDLTSCQFHQSSWNNDEKQLRNYFKTSSPKGNDRSPESQRVNTRM